MANGVTNNDTTTVGTPQQALCGGAEGASSPVSALGSPMSASGSYSGFGGSRRGSFEPNSTNYALDRFMEAFEALSPAGDSSALQHMDKRQSVGNDIGRRSSCGSNSSLLNLSNAERSIGASSVTNPLSGCSSSGPQTPKYHGHFTRARRSPRKHEDGVALSPRSRAGSRRGAAGTGAAARRSLSRSPSSSKRKRNFAQLSVGGDENGAPSPFPLDGGSKNASRALSNSLLTVHQDGAYMQVIFDETHRFASEEDPPDLPLLPSTTASSNAADGACMGGLGPGESGGKGGRKDIDQALSLLQLSGGSASQSEFARSTRRLSGSMGSKGTPGGNSSRISQELIENIMPGSTTTLASTFAAATSSSTPAADQEDPNSWPFMCLPLSPLTPQAPPSSLLSAPPSGAAAATVAAAAAKRLLGEAPGPMTARGKGKGGGRRTGTRSAAAASSGDTTGSGGKANKATSKGSTKAKTRPRGPGGGQRPAVQAPVSTPQGTMGGGPGSFCSKPEALSQLDTSQSELMVLDADLWVVRERGDHCSSNECIYKDKSTGISSRRHYHATCDHRHKGGPKGGMIFHHHQLEKIQKHQRAHIRILHKKTPAEAVLTEANVEPYLPGAWTDQETGVLAHLVGIYGPIHWGTIAAGVATKSETQCMLHWRYALNGNATVKGTGTWQPVEDERMLSLVQIFGQRWSTVAEHMPGRLAKQCRERYLNNLDPDLRRGAWSRQEDEKLLQLRGQQNKSFAKIAEQIEGRSYNDVKNRWSQISRQIAALKKASSDSTRDWNLDQSQSTGGDPSSTEERLLASNSNANLDQGGDGFKQLPSPPLHQMAHVDPMVEMPPPNPVSNPKYKVCVEGGVFTLGEALSGDENSLSPASDVIATPSTSITNSNTGDESESTPGLSGQAIPTMYNPQMGAAAAAVAEEAEHRGTREKRDGGVQDSGDGNQAFGEHMTDAEANAIAGGAFMGFGNDMRVSI